MKIRDFDLEYLGRKFHCAAIKKISYVAYDLLIVTGLVTKPHGHLGTFSLLA